MQRFHDAEMAMESAFSAWLSSRYGYTSNGWKTAFLQKSKSTFWDHVLSFTSFGGETGSTKVVKHWLRTGFVIHPSKSGKKTQLPILNWPWLL